ncbi:MAG: hypothetical protein V8T87_03710 [Victivallales bacterium]
MYIDDTVNFQRFYLREKFAMNTTGDGEFLYPGKMKYIRQYGWQICGTAVKIMIIWCC